MKLGVDLRGGVILVYEVDQSKRKPADQPVNMDKLIEAIKRRVNPAGTKEVVDTQVRQRADRDHRSGRRQRPEASKAEVDHIKRIISSAGNLAIPHPGEQLATTRI